MPNNSDTDTQQGCVVQLYAELLELFEEAQQLQAQSMNLLNAASTMRASILEASCDSVPDATPAPDDQSAPPTARVAPTPEQTLDAMISLLGDFSLETQIALTKALALGVAITAQARLRIKRPPVA
jgi:hypothetical protein